MALNAYQLTFTYQKIQRTWTAGNITAQDNWETPVIRLDSNLV